MKFIHAVMLASALVVAPACSQTSVDTADKEAIEKIVHDYIMENPNIVMDALVQHEENEDWRSINEVRTAIYEERRDASIGPANAKVTIVEFFDYNCGYCKRTTDWISETLEKYPNDVRVIFKESPVLESRTRTSANAAKAALAADKQGKYLEMHVALMAASSLSDKKIDAIAEEIGLDVKQLRSDMENPALQEHIDDTMTLVRKIRPFGGTPFFLFEDDYLAGASVERLDELLEKALNG